MFADTVRDGADEDSEPLKLFPNRFQDDDDEEEDEADEYHVTCPVCEMDFVLSEEDLSKESVACPGCGKTLEFDIQRPHGDN
jgi:C4-type Zn-finger protein